MLLKYCKNILNVAIFFFNSSPRFWQPQFLFLFLFCSHFRLLGYHNSYFLSQFPTISATWLPQLVNHLGTPLACTRALHRQELGRTWISVISLPKFIFFSLPTTSLIFLLSHTSLTILATMLPKFNLFPHFAK